jgi:heavy metal translocating P-type ATPase
VTREGLETARSEAGPLPVRARWGAVARYPLVLATIVTGLLASALQAAGASLAGEWLVIAYCAAIAVYQSWKAVRRVAAGSWGLDVLALSAIVSTLLVGDTWASLIIVLMLTGGAALEDYAQQRARIALTALLRQTPRFAHRLDPDGSLTEIAVDDIMIGDRLQIRPGETVPVDCTLLSSEATVDEATLTGESLPVSRRRGERLLSGSANGGTVIDVRAGAIAADSEFQKIIALVSAASDNKAPFVRMADRFAIPFTALAYTIAGAAWFASGDPARFAEVMVVATPCPLLIAAPVSFIAGMDQAAKSGVIVRGGGALEQLARLRAAAFDKTGTLTRGSPEVDRVEALSPLDEDDLLRTVASVEAQSGHVLAAAVVAAASSRRLPLLTATSTVEIPGKGIAAVVDRREVRVGKREFVASPPESVPTADLQAGETAVYASVDGLFAGRIVLRDETRPEARNVVAALRSLGVDRVLMLTGDAERTAEYVAVQVGVDDIHASLLPGDKVAVISAVTRRPVMMVGDGVNDAPVLAAADVGVAMGARGSTAASETADVVILVDDLGRLVEVVRIARRTVTIATQSIGIGIGLSLMLMLIAAFGVIPAIVGAGLQELIDVVTIVNGLRAARPGPKPRAVRQESSQAPMASSTL